MSPRSVTSRAEASTKVRQYSNTGMVLAGSQSPVLNFCRAICGKRMLTPFGDLPGGGFDEGAPIFQHGNGSGRVPKSCSEFLQGNLREGKRDSLLRPEVAQNRLLVNGGSIRDVLQRGSGVAPFVKQRVGALQDEPAGLLLLVIAKTRLLTGGGDGHDIQH